MPETAESLKNQGNRLLQAGQAEAAIAAYNAALALDPGYVPALNNLGLVLKASGRRVEAAAVLERALALTPDDPELLNNVAVLRHESGRLQEALPLYRDALRLMPDDAFANSNYGGLLAHLGRGEEAVPFCRKAAELRPDSAAVLLGLGKVLRDTGDMDAALPVLARAASLPDAGIEQASAYLYALLYPPANAGGGEWPAYQSFDRAVIQPRLAHAFRHTPRAGRDGRLRLAYLSGALRSHVTFFFIVGVLSQHDHGRFEIILYDTAVSKDAMTERLASLADRAVDCAGLSDRALAERIHADRVDILVDLDGHIGDNGQLALAWRPAPLQATWLGYPHSTGSSAVDLWLTDRHIAGPGHAEPHSEGLGLLPDFYMVFDPGEIPEVSPLPALRNGFLTFGSFNAPNKLNDEVLQSWAAILRALPDSRLVLASSPGERFEARIRATFASAGVASERLSFARACPQAEFLALHHQVDVALDPFPVNGTTTSLFGLWMGVPMLSVAGVSHRARVGLSLLHNLDLADWLAPNPAALPAMAQTIAASIPELAALRSGLRARMRASPLADAARFTRNLEALLLNAWRRKNDGQALDRVF